MHFVVKLFAGILFFSYVCKSTVHAQVVADTLAVETFVAENDSIIKAIAANPKLEEDSTKRKDPKARVPGKAALRSAIIPGWGQVYNRKIWKVPIVYAALGFTGGIFVNNITWYNRTKYAFRIATAIQSGQDSIGSASYLKVNEQLRRVFFEGYGGVQPEALRTNRDYFRKNLDYAAIYFVIAWALNVVDATVDAHLSSFDVSPDLSFKFQPGYSAMAGTAGVSFVLKLK